MFHLLPIDCPSLPPLCSLGCFSIESIVLHDECEIVGSARLDSAQLGAARREAESSVCLKRMLVSCDLLCMQM